MAEQWQVHLEVQGRGKALVEAVADEAAAVQKVNSMKAAQGFQDFAGKSVNMSFVSLVYKKSVILPPPPE